MKTMTEIMNEDKPKIAKLLGVSGSKLLIHGNDFHMSLKGKVKATELNRLFAASYGYSRIMEEIKNHFNDQTFDISKKLLKLDGYILDFHYDDQSGRATMVLKKVCPCCGKY